MLEIQYSNRELDAHFKEIKATLERIEAQTTRTNGRVSSLEMWRSYVVGGLAIISAIILPIAFSLLK